MSTQANKALMESFPHQAKESGGTLPGGSFQKANLLVTCLFHPEKPS